MRSGLKRSTSVISLVVLFLGAACSDKRSVDVPDVVAPPPSDPLPSVGEDFSETPPSGMAGRIVYLSIEGSGGAFHPFVMDPDGSNSTPLVEADSPYSYSGSTWSPDATRIAFATNLDGNAVWNIWGMNVDGTGVTKIVESAESRDFAPSWSPDGRFVAFQSERVAGNSFDIFLFDSSDGSQVNLTDSPLREELPTWSPDGEQIAYQVVRATGGGTDIWLMNRDGSGKVGLTDTSGFQNASPAWSPDGQWIAFESTRHDSLGASLGFADSEIYAMRSDGSEVRRLTVGVGINETARFPTWSPDGQHLAYELTDFSQGGLFPRTAIVVMNADGSNQYAVPNQSLDGLFPRWSPR